MKYGYIDKINSVKEFQQYILLFEQQEVSLDNITINLDFENFSTSLNEGDTVVVCSYVGLFPSLGSYLTTAIELLGNGITIESLLEPNVCINCSNSDLIRELNVLNRQLRSTSSLKSITKLKNEGKQVGRPCGSSKELQKKVIQVEKLRKESNISVVAACKLVECNLKTYYRLKNKEGVSSNTLKKARK